MKLRLVGRSRGVESTVSMLPHNLILRVVLQLEALNARPEQEELAEMLNQEIV